MKTFFIPLGLGLLVAGCNISSEEDQLENSIRANLGAQGNVQQVELTRQDENNLSGFAVVRDSSGIEGRYSCTAQRTQGTNFNWRCNQQIDDQVITRVENEIRQNLARQAEVVQIELSRQDDNRMTGYALLRGADGSEVRTNCTATRSAENAANFDYQCAPEGQGAAPAAQDGK